MTRIIALIIGRVGMDEAFSEWRVPIFPLLRAASGCTDTASTEVICVDEADLIYTRNAFNPG